MLVGIYRVQSLGFPKIFYYGKQKRQRSPARILTVRACLGEAKVLENDRVLLT